MDIKKIVSSFVFVFLFLSNLFAAAGTTVFSFLKLPKNATQAALANVTTFDKNLYFTNPALLGFTDHLDIQASKAIHFQDTGYYSFNFIMPYSKLGFSVSFVGFDYGKIDSFSENAAGDYCENGSFEASDYCVQTGAGYRIVNNLSLGANIKYIVQDIANLKMKGLGFDLGALLAFNDESSIALGFENLGARVEGYGLPSNIYLSYANKIIEPCQLGLELQSFFDDTIWLKSSLEVGVNENFILRGGYKFALTHDNSSLGSWYQRNLSLGFGLNISVVCIDYAWLPFGQLGNSNIISLKMEF